MVFADAKDIETDLVSQRDRFEQLAKMFCGVDCPARRVNGSATKLSTPICISDLVEDPINLKPENSFGPTSRTWSVAGLLFCSRAQFGRTNPNPGRYALPSN